MEAFEDDITRREFVGVTAGVTAGTGLFVSTAYAAPPKSGAETVRYSLTINGHRYDLQLEPRVTLLDLLRERIGLTGTKKGCDHGQCGACTVLADGVRINSCLTLAVTQADKEITTIEGLASGGQLHPLQAAFIEHDGFQCGFCTSGQICSAIGMLNEVRAGVPSLVPREAPVATISGDLNDDELRERMAGNICRCGAYPNIIAAIQAVHESRALRGSK